MSITKIPATYLGMQNNGSGKRQFGARYRPPDTNNIGLFFGEVLKTFNTEEEAKDFVKNANDKFGTQSQKDTFAKSVA
jgi:hypothetical protein